MRAFRLFATAGVVAVALLLGQASEAKAQFYPGYGGYSGYYVNPWTGGYGIGSRSFYGGPFGYGYSAARVGVEPVWTAFGVRPASYIQRFNYAAPMGYAPVVTPTYFGPAYSYMPYSYAPIYNRTGYFWVH
jgi:hypothetical protein